MTPEQHNRRKLLFRKPTTRQELRDWVYVFLDLDLPGVAVDPDSNSSPLDFAWDAYSYFLAGGQEGKSRILEYACRDGGKTLTESVVEVLVLLHFGSVVHLAAILEQSTNAQRYLKKFFQLPDLMGFKKGDNITLTEVVYYRPKDGDLCLTEEEFADLPPGDRVRYDRIVHRDEVVVATMQSVNGKHALLLCLDEIDVLRNAQVYQETANIPTPWKGPDGVVRLPLTVLTSTRKFAYGLVQDEINRADKSGLVVKHFNIIDVTQRCPPERHRPDLPRLPIYRSPDRLAAVPEEAWAAMDKKEQALYARDEGFQGCLSNCSLFAACRGHLATRQTSDSSFLKPLAHVANQFRNNSLEMAKAQLMCWKPSTTGLIYPSLDRRKHMITPASAYRMVYGEDPPQGDRITKAELLRCMLERDVKWVGGMDHGYSHDFAVVHGFVDGNRLFITHAFAYTELEPSQQVEVCEVIRPYDPTIYPDTENPQMNKVFKKAGFRMKDWQKAKGSVVGGIDIVRMKLMTAAGEPTLFIVRDVASEEPGIDLLYKQKSEYHWKLDAAGQLTDVPDDKNDHLVDAERYLVMNVFAPKGRVVVAGPEPQGKRAEPKQKTAHDWLAEQIQSSIGGPSAPSEEEPEEDRKGKKGRFLYDFS